MQRFLRTAFKRKQDFIAETERQKYLDVVNGRLTKIKYCSSCHIYRPPRTVHCGACGCCIERLDHHCPWIGTCVGKRNYKYFILFMWSLFLICLFAIITCGGHIADYKSFGRKSGTDEISISGAQVGSIVILTITCGLSLFVFFLFGYHQYLLCRNETTNENLKKSYAVYGNPFQKGICDNIRRICRRDKRNWKPE